MTCSLIHTGSVHRAASAIRILLSDLDTKPHQIMVCRQCSKMLCLKGEAKKTDEALVAAFHWEVKDRQGNCPFHALHSFEGKLIHCNLCEGTPECVESCPTGALSIRHDVTAD